MHLVTLWGGVNGRIDIARALFGGIFGFLALIGNYLSKVRRNFWMGVRTPWTLANDIVWERTHRFAAWMFTAAGIIGFVVSIAGLNPLWSLGLILVAALTPVIYSLVIYKQLERRGQLQLPTNGNVASAE